MNINNNPPDVVVGIALGANRIGMLEMLLRNLPRGRRIAVVAVVRGPPGTSSTVELKGDSIPFRVRRFESGVALESDSVYLAEINQHRSVALRHGHISLEPLHLEQSLDPIDVFFIELARELRHDAVAVSLLDDAEHGQRGLQAIQQAGGLTLVEIPDRDAVGPEGAAAKRSWTADYYLPCSEIADELVQYLEHRGRPSPQEQAADLNDQLVQAIPQIAQSVQRFTGKDIKHYRTPTLVRRIRRRLQVNKISSVDTYVELIRRSRDESEHLFRDLLIGVTGFFRDPDAFARLGETVVAKLVKSCPLERPIRVWIPGCASGEEAYSIAILFHEAIQGAVGKLRLQIFATDLDDDALRAGQRGRFPSRIREELSPERLERFFRKRGHGFEIRPEVRDAIVFLKHDLIHDPPFSDIDLISCRNLLIYFGDHLQAKLIPLFHQALRPNGFLFLGPSESLAEHRELFRVVDERSRIVQRKSTALSITDSRFDPAAAVRATDPANSAPTEIDFHKIGQKIVLDEFGPQWTIIDDAERIIALSSDMMPFLKLSGGAFKNHLSQMVLPGLRVGLRAALAEARKKTRRVVREGLSVAVPGGKQRIALTVQPMPQFGEGQPLFFVAFQKTGEPLPRGHDPAKPNHSNPARRGPAPPSLVDQLEQELATTRHDLERNVQELERNNLELKASNAELLAINEELRTANEELQAARQQNLNNNRRLAETNNDLENLLRSTHIATIFLDSQRAIRGFTPAATELYGLVPGDIGRPLDQLQPRFRPPIPLPTDAELQQATTPIEHSVATPDNRWFIRRTLPYYRQDKLTDGVVITFSEVTRLRESESHLRRIIDNMLGFVGVLNPVGTLVEINEAALCAGGVQSADVIGKKFWECIWWSYDPAIMAQLQSAIARASSGKVVRYDTQIRVRDDERIWLDLMLVPVTDAAGQVTHIIQSGVDIDKRVHAQQRLEQTEQLNRLMADNISQMAWIADESGNITWFNQRWFEFTGTTLGQVEGADWQSVLHPDHAHRVAQSFDQAIAQGAFWEDTFPLRGPEGGYRWFLARAVPARDVEGRIRHWFGTKTDITERMHYEQELQRSQAQLKVSIAIAGLALAEVDYRLDRIQLSQEAAELFGLGHAACELPRRKIFELFHPDERDQVIEAYESALLPASGGVIEIKHQIVRPDGSVRWINIRKQVFFHHDDNHQEIPQYGLWAILDITEQKAVEAALETARRQAESASQAKSDFLANMSHEIRSPMAAILGYADLIDAQDQDTREKVETIRRNGQFLLALVNDILDLSSIEAGKFVVDLERFSPITLVEDVCALMHVRAEESGIELKYEFDGPLPGFIFNDPVRLRQILINLVGNAIKFTERGSVTVVARYVYGSGQMQFEVIDTGIGMSPEQVDRLFLPFEQADSSIRRVYGGSGLGLAISQRLAKLLGGEIHIRSVPGEGSTLTLTVAATRSASDGERATLAEDFTSAHAAQRPLPIDNAVASPIPGNVRAMIVDDRRDLRLLAKRFIERIGGDVLVAEDGGQALEIAQRERHAGRPIDIVFMDLQMPKMDGITTTQLLRAQGFKNPIIALTANAMESDRQTCLSSGFTDFLSKPIDTNELRQILTRYRPSS